MKKIVSNPILLLLPLFGICGWGCQTHSPPDSRTPRIRIEPAVVDLGRIPEGRIASGGFTIINETGRGASVENILTGCGCTAIKWSRRTLVSGERMDVKFEFDSHNRFGEETRFISVYVNGIDTMHYFKFKAFVE